MKRVKPKTITELLPLFLREEGLETPLQEYRITHQGWVTVVGQTIAEHTEKITIYNQVLYVLCDSAVVKQELIMRRSEIIQKLNLYVDSYVISNLIVR